MGLMAGPDKPAVMLAMRGLRVSASMAMATKVLTSEMASAPASCATRAIWAMLVTLGESFTINGRWEWRRAEDAGADAISLVNTFVAMAIDAETRKPRIANITAGLSGPAIKPIALRMVYDAAKAVKIPVIGMGGISTAEDIIEFMLAGATAVEIGTASFWDPCATEKIVDELERWCVEHRIEKLADLTGGLVIE